MTVFMFSFYNIRGSYLWFLIILSTASVVSKYAYNQIISPGDLLNPFLLIMIVVATLFTYYFNKETDNGIRQNAIIKNRFKKIMDLSNEGIVIVKDQKIEYVNDKFIEY
jgi:hypothetical protein